MEKRFPFELRFENSKGHRTTVLCFDEDEIELEAKTFGPENLVFIRKNEGPLYAREAFR